MDEYVALVIMKSSARMDDASNELALRDIIEKEFTDPVCRSVITEVSEVIIRKVTE